jgi:hypothetical protein
MDRTRRWAISGRVVVWGPGRSGAVFPAVRSAAPPVVARIRVPAPRVTGRRLEVRGQAARGQQDNDCTDCAAHQPTSSHAEEDSVSNGKPSIPCGTGGGREGSTPGILQQVGCKACAAPPPGAPRDRPNRHVNCDLRWSRQVAVRADRAPPRGEIATRSPGSRGVIATLCRGAGRTCPADTGHAIPRQRIRSIRGGACLRCPNACPRFQRGRNHGVTAGQVTRGTGREISWRGFRRPICAHTKVRRT